MSGLTLPDRGVSSPPPVWSASPNRNPVSVQWRSFELRPKGAPPIPPEYRARIEAGRPRLYAIARGQYGLEMNPGPFDFDSHPALIGAKYAEQMGVGPAYHAAAMRAHWQKAQRLDDLTVLATLAESVGLEQEGFLAALQDAELEGEVLQDITQAHAYSINGVPAMVFDDFPLHVPTRPFPIIHDCVIGFPDPLDALNIGNVSR
jgi:predicted DsbA family dithiol-disulfide isomerase